MKDAILAKLAEVEEMLLDASCEGQSFGENLQAEMGWAAELEIALRALTDTVDYYVD